MDSLDRLLSQRYSLYRGEVSELYSVNSLEVRKCVGGMVLDPILLDLCDLSDYSQRSRKDLYPLPRSLGLYL